MAPAFILAANTNMRVGTGLIQRRKGTVHVWIGLYIDGYIRWGTQGSHRVHLLWQEFVFHLCLVTIDCFVSYTLKLGYFGFLQGVFLNFDLVKFGHWNRNGQDVNRASHRVIDDRWLNQSFVYHAFHCSPKGKSLGGLDA